MEENFTISLRVTSWQILGKNSSYEVRKWLPTNTIAARLSDHGDGKVFWMVCGVDQSVFKSGKSTSKELALIEIDSSLRDYCTQMI